MSSEQEPLNARLLQGLERLCTVLRGERRAAGDDIGLSLTQHAILEYLVRRPAETVRVKDVADGLGVSSPTATDSVLALERKGLVGKSQHPDDARAASLEATREGLRAFASAPVDAGAMSAALSALPAGEQADLLLLTIKLIRSLQQAKAIAPQRVCVTCKYFRPFVHGDAGAPHHCEFVDAAFGDRDLRVDCGDHDAAEDSAQSANWARLTRLSAATSEDQPNQATKEGRQT